MLRPWSVMLLAATGLASAGAPARAWAQYGEEPDDADPPAAPPAEPAAPPTADPMSAEPPDGDDEAVGEAGDEDGSEDDGAFGVDGLELEWGGRVQSDLRFRLEEKSVGAWYDRRALPVGIDRNENLFGLRLTARYGAVTAKADLDFVLYGYSQGIETLEDLSARERIDPYRIEAHSLYVEIEDLVVDGFDLRVGQQLVLWGVGDQFNPTNNLNADDVEDVLLFGEQQGNFMVRGDWWIDEDWSITGVLVPIFKPALLPRSGKLAIARVDRLPMVDEAFRWRLHSEQAAVEQLAGYPAVVTEVEPILPDAAIDNMAVAYRIGGTLGEQDISVSYYNGRTDFPQPARNHTVQNTTPRCNPDDPADCINGTLETQVELRFPRMHVYGFNLAGELPLDALSDALKAVGYRIEAALIVPQRADIQLDQDALDLGLAQLPAGEYDYNGPSAPGLGHQPAVVDDTPFAKWTVGLDYTFTEHLYANVQWVHGLADEYGAGDWMHDGVAVREGGVADDAEVLVCAVSSDGTACAREITRPRLGDYLVLGIDVRALQQKLLLRLFTIFDLVGVDERSYHATKGVRVVRHRSMFTEDGFGAVIYPEVGYNFGNGLELGAGALMQLGKDWGKFGDPAAGGSLAWSRVRFSF